MFSVTKCLHPHGETEEAPNSACRGMGVASTPVCCCLSVSLLLHPTLSVQESYVCTGHSACRSAGHFAAVLPQQPKVLGHEREN